MTLQTRSVVMVVAVVCSGILAGGVVAGEPATGPSVAGEHAKGTSAAAEIGTTGTTGASGSSGSLAQADCSFPVTLTDATGTEVTVEERPERIVVLQASDAQIVWEINASDRIVGMTQGPSTAYLNDTEGITHVKNDDATVDVEQVTNLSADLVLAANVTQSGSVEQLRNTGVPVYNFGEVSSMEETYRNINRTGRLVGNCEAAAERVSAMKQRLDRISRAVADREEPGVLYLFYGFTAGNDTHVHSMIEIAGGENVYANETSYPEVSEEYVAAADPQWIVQPSGAPAPTGAGFNGTTAVQQDQVLTVSNNYANQAGPRVVRVVEAMAQSFHPEAFDENGDPIVETSTPTVTSTPTESSTTEMATNTADETPRSTTTNGSGPGFTSATVVVAILGAVLVLARRRKGV